MRLRLLRSRRSKQRANGQPRQPLAAGPRVGHYLTDGRRLYRVVSHLYPARRGRQVGLLEDCLTLELSPYSPAEFQTMNLVSVGAPIGAA